MADKPAAEQKLVFGISPNDAAGTYDLLLQVSPECWGYMKDGKTHHLDLRKVGIPFRIMIAGCADRASAIKLIEDHNKSLGIATLREPGRDYGIETKDG